MHGRNQEQRARATPLDTIRTTRSASALPMAASAAMPPLLSMSSSAARSAASASCSTCLFLALAGVMAQVRRGSAMTTLTTVSRPSLLSRSTLTAGTLDHAAHIIHTAAVRQPAETRRLTCMHSSQQRRMSPSVPVTPMPSTMSRVRRKGTSSGVVRNLPCSRTNEHE